MQLIPAGNPSLWTGPTGTNTYFLAGERPTLIDAGVGRASHLSALERHLGARDLAQILLTHSHSDHASGVPVLQARWPGAVVRSAASVPLTDGERIAAGDGWLAAVHTPGHAPDHYCFVDRERGEVYCGDLVRSGGTIVIPAGRGGDLRAYLRSLERLRDLQPKRLLPGHGPAIEDPAGAIDEYIAHRAQREAQVVESLRRGRRTPEEMVPDIYGGLATMLVRAAAESVLAHLRKLEDEGRAHVVDGGWRLTR